MSRRTEPRRRHAPQRGLKLNATALRYLKDRGVSSHAAAKRRLRVVTAVESRKLFGTRAMFLVIPYFDRDRKPLLDQRAPFLRGRILGAGPGFSDGARKSGRFRQPQGTGNHLYLDPARTDWREILADPSRPLLITEGEVKAMCATEYVPTPCIALSGVWSWRTRVTGQSVALPELDAITWAGRDVELAFDSDIIDKPAVRAALHALALELIKRGARVTLVAIPTGETGGKVGVDDFLVKHGAEAFAKLTRCPAALVLDPTAPLDSARAFVGARYTEPEGRSLHHHAGDFYRWTGVAYVRAENGAADIRAEVYAFLGRANERGTSGERTYRPTKGRVDQTIDALRAETHLPADRVPPRWLDGRDAPAPADLIPMANGLLHLPTRNLLPHDPRLFATSALPFAYDPRPHALRAWLAFLKQLWPDDPDAIATLQEFIGYLLTADTRHQKILLIVGPKRSGKGTIAKVIEALVGPENHVGPMLSSLSANFGLEPLIGKSVAIVSDARLGGRAELQVTVERLLSISGGDTLTVDRKYASSWSGRFPTRFVICTNELPRFADASGALPSRLVVLTLTTSFYGREDLGLLGRLLAELPGIFGWALDGLDRLRARGHFVPPKSSDDAVRDLEDLASPVAAFLRERCDLAPGNRVPCDVLYQAWAKWSHGQGHAFTSTTAMFGRDLRAACPGLKRSHLRVKVNGKQDREWNYEGIALRPLTAGATASGIKF